VTRAFVELCAGTAAVSFALFGSKPPVPMMGSKRTLAPQVLALMGLDPTAIERVVLVDQGEWALTYGTLLPASPGERRRACGRVAAILRDVAAVPDRELFDAWRGQPPPDDPNERAARHLFLQSRTFRGKEVSPLKGGSGWRTHGFDPEYRAAVTPGGKDRGFFNARPALARKVEALAAIPFPLVQCDAVDVRPSGAWAWSRCVVLLDPPYRGREPYCFGMSRPEVVEVARQWARGRDNDVYVCEGEPIAELVAEGWTAVELTTRRGATQLSRAGHAEWITHRRAAC